MRLLVLGLLLLLATASAYADPLQKNSSFAPPLGKTLLLVGQDRETITEFIKGTGIIPGGVMIYTSVQELKGLDFPTDYGSGFQDGNTFIRRYQHSTIQIGLYMVGALDEILGGQYNENFKSLAKWIKKANRPVYLRIGYEFDLPDNHYDSKKYKQVFRYIVDFLRKEDVHNVAYVWHTCSIEDPNHPWMNWYPGDEYVDWFGVSLFGTNLIYVEHFLTLARQHKKPFMIAESTPEGLYILRSKINWLKKVFNFIKEYKIEAFCYIDSNWDVMPMFKGQSWGDSRIEKHSELKKIWLNEINQESYLKGSKDLFEVLGWNKR